MCPPAEFHDYTTGGEVSSAKHLDEGSLVTITVMLTERSAFQGGAFCETLVDGRVVEKAPVAERGDAMCFVSHKYHSVQPVTGGNRKTLVVEIWEGPRCVGDRNY